jgi:hypothetical protein
MCASCEAGEVQAGISPALASRARRIEAEMPGGRVSEEAWEILLGRRGGAVGFGEMQRMLACVDAAGRSVGARLRCDAG